MTINAVKTPIVTQNTDLYELVLSNIPTIANNSVLALSAKIVSISQGNTAPNTADRDALIQNNSQYYLPKQKSMYRSTHTITKSTLMRGSGIDESNADGNYVLWPNNPLNSIKQLRTKFLKHYKITNFGMLIVDSTSTPLRIGTIGTSLAHYGFKELKDYRGSKDLFGKPMQYSQANHAEALATAAVFAMGEGAEQTPIVVFEEVANLEFGELGGTCYDQSPESYKDDLFEPFLKSVDWHPGGDL